MVTMLIPNDLQQFSKGDKNGDNGDTCGQKKIFSLAVRCWIFFIFQAHWLCHPFVTVSVTVSNP